MTFSARATSYDEVPYADDPYPSSHPGHLAAVATLAGLAPPAVEHCQVLELGCARGGNLVPMAAALSGSRFVGIDSSPGQVTAARELISALKLENVTVERRDIRDVGPDFGTFDYIICHGTYSWVTDEVQDKILEIAARNLAPTGVAYLSYNTHPGWRLRGVVRDLMCYRTKRSAGAADRAEQARRVLAFIASSAAPFDRNYAARLGEEAEYVRRRSDSYLLHEHLEEVNDPVYFHQLVERAAAKKLRFVAEAQSSALAVESFPTAVVDGLRELAGDEIEFEQYLDFLVNRKFRQSLFCHAAAHTGRNPGVADLSHLRAFSTGPVSIRGPVAIRSAPFRNERLLRCALHELSEIWPRSIACQALTSRARARNEVAPSGDPAVVGRDERDLAADLIACYKLKIIGLKTDQDSFVVEIGDTPTASPLARIQAGRGTSVTNLRHEAGRLNEFSRFVLRHLDGSHDRSALLVALDQAQKEGKLDIAGIALATGVGANDRGREDHLPGDIGAMLDRCLGKLARFALLQ
jgi:methyltransferase-like protein